MDNLRVILIPVSNDFNGRKFAEEIENQEITLDSFFATDEGKDCIPYTLSDFMDQCNNQEINLNEYWVSYIKII